MLVEKPEELKEWLTSTLKKMCDADPDALGKYIFALLKKDKKEMKTFLLEQLEVFLMDETSKFVELLFDALLTKSYIKSAVLGDVGVKLSSTVDIAPCASSLPTKNVKSTLDSTETDMLKDKKELESKPTNDLTDESHRSSTENTDLPHKRKSIFDDKRNSVHKKSCKPSCSKEELTRSRSNSVDIHKDNVQSHSCSKEGEEEYTPTLCGGRVPQESRSDLISKVEPSPKKIKHCDPIPHGDTDYRERKTDDLQSTSTSRTENVHKERECPAYSTKHATRCKDYDEKGYCLRGNFCGYDHGTDPILVEHTPDQFLTSLKAVNFGVNLTPDQFEREDTKSPLPPLPTSPPSVPPPPPPPPLPSPTGFAAEPYNPESPGMNMVAHISLFNRSEPPPPHLPSMTPTSSSRMSSLFFGKADPFYNKPKPGRIRELINVTKTVDSSNNRHNKDHRTCLKPLNSVYPCGASKGGESANHTHTRGGFKAKRFDFSRLGPCPRTSLEIRKIPSRLNTIKNLHQHFSKFGNIVNIEIGFDNDPEAAKISFTSNSEATAAYRSTDAILQNRFIKVFWNNDVQKKRMGTNFSKEVYTREFLPPSLSPENLIGVTLDNIPESIEDEVFKDGLMGNVDEKPLASKESMPRSVFISNPSPQGVKKVFSKLTAYKGMHEQEGGITSLKMKRVGLHQAKTELVNNAIQHQKLILDQLMKTTKKKEKMFLKKTLDTISKKVTDLTEDLKKDNAELKSLLKSSPQMAVSKIAAKELLDAELDLYKKQHTHCEEDTTELLLKKVNLMKTKAKALGLIESSSCSLKSVFRRNVSSRYTASLSIDHRPRKILVFGKKSTDKEDMKKHFKQFGKIEKLEEAFGGIVIAFYTRVEAEAAYVYGTKFEDNNLTLSWLNDTQLNVNHTPDFSNENPEQKTIEMQSVEVEDEEEEDEEEDSEARSWRH